ncbi:MAG: coproporphyrinogen III oxidase [Methanoregulaceae archaeon PtaB.Bin152]|nr:MAG: coproporphyrinogen III oxidase [Methanoregulaceae archaeon PtaB.Bin152]
MVWQFPKDPEVNPHLVCQREYSQELGMNGAGYLPGRNTIRSIVQKRVYIKTYGCTYNEGDSRKLAAVLEHQGCTLVSRPEEADAVIVNTCTVIGATERKVLRHLRALRSCPLYVTGCMATVQRDAILSACNPVFIHPGEIHAAYAEEGDVPAGPVGIVQVCQGCRGSCSYCITRMARGPLVSADTGAILGEVRALVRNGAVEIRLTGQDVSAWGTDIGSHLGALLQEISGVPGVFRVRVGMMNPATLSPIQETVAGAFAGEKIFKFLHLPVQSGSDTVLERMGRGYTASEVLAIVKRFRAHCPGISLHTDLICGYPGETDEEFYETLGLLSRMQPDKVNITRYSPRPQTPAAREKDMPDRFKKERSRVLLTCAEKIAKSRNAAWVSREVPVLITEILRPGSAMGRTQYYQGVVVKGDLSPGTVRMVRLTEDRTYYFIGELV